MRWLFVGVLPEVVVVAETITVAMAVVTIIVAITGVVVATALAVITAGAVVSAPCKHQHQHSWQNNCSNDRGNSTVASVVARTTIALGTVHMAQNDPNLDFV